MKKFFWVLITVAAIAITGCDKNDDLMDDELTPPENKEQIRTQDENKKDSVPPGHHPENDDNDPYGGKYDPIWR